MKPRERVLRAIHHQEPDRLPLDWPGAPAELMAGIRSKLKASSDEEISRLFEFDLRTLGGLKYTGPQRYYKGLKADFWGVPLEAQSGGDSSSVSPLQEVSTVEEVEKYQWPNPDDFNGDHIPQKIGQYSDYAIVAGLWAPIFHHLHWLCGFEDSLAYFHTQPEVMAAILRHVTDFWIGCAKKTLELGKGRIDLVDTYNDMGTQNDLIISPDTFRKFMKPELKRLADVIKGYGAKVFVHSCGSVSKMIPDLIDIGVDVLDPIQVAAADMEPETLKARFGKHITFHGAIDTQHFLPEHNAEEVRKEVRRVAGILGQGGGYILSGSQNFQNDIPAENIIAMYDEAKKIKF